jgi:hypothetical protein
MGTPSNYYVDPTNGDDATGDGTSGNPWQTTDHALTAGITRDVTNGDQVNIRDTSIDSSLLSVDIAAVYGNPTAAAPLILRGYASSADDGGTGTLSGSGGRIFNTSADFVSMIDLRCTDGGSGEIIKGDNSWSLMRCQFDNTTGNAVDLDDDLRVVNCYFKDIGGYGVYPGQRTFIRACTFENDGGGKEFAAAVTTATTLGWVIIEECIFKLSGASIGITHSAHTLEVRNCSIYSNGGTGSGITGGSSQRLIVCVNNLVEGFSGSGGYGIRLRSWDAVTYGHNACYDNTTDYDISADQIFDLGDNETLSATPFTDASGKDFSPADTGNVLAGSYPKTFKGFAQTQSRDKGAIQHAPAGGGGSRRSRIRRHN